MSSKGEGAYITLIFTATAAINNSTSNVLPGGVNFTAAAGDVMVLFQHGTVGEYGQWTTVSVKKHNPF